MSAVAHVGAKERVPPLFLVSHTLPHTEGWARAWWRALLALLAAPVAQAMLLTATLRVFLTGDLLALPAGGGLIDLLVIGCLLYLLFKIPFWAINSALSGAPCGPPLGNFGERSTTTVTSLTEQASGIASCRRNPQM